MDGVAATSDPAAAIPGALSATLWWPMVVPMPPPPTFKEHTWGIAGFAAASAQNNCSQLPSPPESMQDEAASEHEWQEDNPLDEAVQDYKNRHVIGLPPESQSAVAAEGTYPRLVVKNTFWDLQSGMTPKATGCPRSRTCAAELCGLVRDQSCEELP